MLVAQKNAEYVSRKLGVHAKSIVKGGNLNLVTKQPQKTSIYCSTGKFVQMLDMFMVDANLTTNLCVVISDWHTRN